MIFWLLRRMAIFKSMPVEIS